MPPSQHGCDASAGVCEPPSTAGSTHTGRSNGSAGTPTLVYVTDPLCSGCWAFEPAWRRLRYHYQDVVTVRIVYGGLLAGWEGFSDPAAGIAAPADVAAHWQQVAARSGQPIDPQVWLTDPPSSSYPASKAAHIVRMLDPAAEERFLRRVREAVFLQARNIARRDVLVSCAADAGIDTQAFSVLFDADAGAHGLASDLRDRQLLGVRQFPTVLISTATGQRPRTLMPGSPRSARAESALLRALAIPAAKPATAPTVDAALHAYRSGTTPEFAALLHVTPQHAESQLAAAGATRRRLDTGHHWTANPHDRPDRHADPLQPFPSKRNH